MFSELFGKSRDCLVVFCVSTLLVVLGAAFGRQYLSPGKDSSGVGGPLLRGFVRWDGNFYRAIAKDGYSYQVGRQSTIHFMPLFPLAAKGVLSVTGLDVTTALVLTSHLCFLGTLVLLAYYTDLRYGAEAPWARSIVILALGFLPTSLFFHLAYTESLFLLISVGQLVLIERKAHPVLVALLVCFGVLARPVGAAMVFPLVVYAWDYGSDRGRSFGWVCMSLPIALAGLAAFMGYCFLAFDDPIAFVRNRDDLWRIRPSIPLPEKLWLLITFEPVWSVFVPGSSSYWGRLLKPGEAVFNTHLAGPFYFVSALILTAFGAKVRRLNRSELALICGLLLIPYWMTAYEYAMVSMARYVAVIAPLYSFGAFLLARTPGLYLAVAAGVGGFFLGVFAALFCQGHWVI